MRRPALPNLASILPLLFLFVPIRLWQLRRSNVKVRPAWRGFVKLSLSSGFLVLQMSPSWEQPVTHPRGLASFFSIATFFVAGSGLWLLSVLEHCRSVKPSDLLVLYLVVSLFGDLIHLTTPENQLKHIDESSIPIFGRICLELILLASETQGKRSILNGEYQHLAPEETSGILGRLLFWWINSILRFGNKTILVAGDLPPTDRRLSSVILRRKILKAWDGRAKPERMNTLPLVLLDCLKWPFVSAVSPRLFLIIFRYSQAVLINIAIQFVINEEKESDTGYWLIVATVVIYTGMALSTAAYQHSLNRLKVMIRGALIGLIHHRSLHVQSGNHDNADAVTLMSNDVDSLVRTGEMFHETWAQLLEVIIGTYLLAVQIGWLCLVPLIIVFLCSQMSRYVAKNLKTRQKNWNVATQKRIAMTSTMLAAVKSMKMLGMGEAVKSKIQDLRDQEIEASKKLRWMMVAYNASANALGIFSPVITLVLFAIIWAAKGDGKFDADIAFTSTAILAMVTHPANMIMTIVPRAIASLANFERVQNYLLECPRLDQRKMLSKTDGAGQGGKGKPAIILENLSIQYEPDSQPILGEINLSIDEASIVVCSGPVGSGKSILAKAILGEVSPSHGSISVSNKHIGYCTQVPWLPSGSIREVICGRSKRYGFGSRWYDIVVQACALHIDLEDLPEDDETQIGSRGLNLSGGQRQRVALARAVYARNTLLVLDDPFSALDGKTENHIVQSLLGLEGILRKMGTTIFWISNSAQHFNIADHIVVLGQYRIQAQGTWEELKHTSNQVLKIALHETVKREDAPREQEIVKFPSQKPRTEDAVHDLTRKTGDLAIYGYYFESIGLANLLMLICCTSSYSFFMYFSQYWLKWWTETTVSETGFYVGGFVALSILAWTTTNGIAWTTLIRIAPRSGAILHQRLLNTIVGVPLSYFSENNLGVMLNRFGQDIQLVDRELPIAISSLFVQAFKLTVQAALLFSVQRTMTITLPFIAIMVYFVQKIYLRTSRQLRLIELESRSAVYSSFLETVEGIATVRAFCWQREFELDNIEQLDKSQEPFYLLLCLQRWLNVVLDLLIAGIAIAVISLSVVLRQRTTPAQIGVAMNMILVASTTLLRLVENWTTLEISLGAISRLKSTVEGSPQEDKPWQNLRPVECWPQGCLEIEAATVSYNSTVIALESLSVKIEAGQKVVVFGRTGSGKSTLLLTLLGFLELQDGSIKIDGTEITQIPRQILRQRCFITVPQDPFFLYDASLRFNLDTLNRLSEKSIADTLEQVQLWKHFLDAGQIFLDAGQIFRDEDIPDEYAMADRVKDILDMPMSTFPPLSTGQQQLLSIARAILQRNSALSGGRSYEGFVADINVSKPILLLDEATSSLDPTTDAIMQDVIQSEFTENGHTVIIVAHRVSSLAKGMRPGVDVVLLMKDGRLEMVGDVKNMSFSAELEMDGKTS